MPRLEPGAVAPAFTLLDADENPVSLSDYAGQKVIVYFYPAASTPGCTTQACNFRDELATLKDPGHAVIRISPGQPGKLAKVPEPQGLTFPLLSDPEKATL